MKRIILFFIVFLSFLSTVEAQQSLNNDDDCTPYEKQRFDLVVEATKMVLDALSEQDKMVFSITMMSAVNEAKNDYEIMTGFEDMLCTMFGVASLTNPENVNSYHEYQTTNQMKTIAKWYFDERAKIEKQKTQLDIVREKERLSGFYALQQDVKSAFLKWSEKGTYEKQTDYLLRLKSNANDVFDSICRELCIKQYFDKIKTETVGYDVDNEVYSIKTYYIVNKQETSPVMLTTNMPVDNAKRYKIPYKGYMVPINLYRYDGFLHSNKLLDGENNYYFCSDFASSEPVTISYNSFNINNEDLNSVMAGYVFNYNDYMTGFVHVSDSIDERVAVIGRKIDVLHSFARDLFARDLGRRGPFDMDYSYGNWKSHCEEIYYDNKYVIIRDQGRMSKVTEYENQCVEYVKNEFSVYRPLFDSDDDFVEFFFNETGVSENALQQLIKSKFDELTATINSVKELKGAKDTQKGKKMLEFCAMADKDFMGGYTYQLLKEFVLQNKVLNWQYKYHHNASYVLTLYVEDR